MVPGIGDIAVVLDIPDQIGIENCWCRENICHAAAAPSVLMRWGEGWFSRAFPVAVAVGGPTSIV